MSEQSKSQSIKLRYVIVIFVLAALIMALFQGIFHRRHARGAANVNEGLETALLYVDAVNGSDGNPGTAGAPLKTIGAAVTLAETNNQNGLGTKVIINPGTYREAVTIKGGPKTTSAPITFQGSASGAAIV